MERRFLFAVTNRILKYIIRMVPRKYELPVNYYKYRAIGMPEEEIVWHFNDAVGELPGVFGIHLAPIAVQYGR